MNKAESLRAHLLATVAEFKHDPDRMMIFIDNGKVRCTAAKSLSFEYSFDLQIVLAAFAGHPDSIMLPLLGWLSVNQSELLENLDKVKNGFKFEAEILSKELVDLSITLPLTEKVIVGQDDQGNTTVKHPNEPQRVAGYLDPNWKPGAQGNTSEWFVPDGK
ncbi:phage tail protein [Pseudomonas sp. 06C 126]|uniref:phage tail protein n=1 Tax=Pseudomonas sp. 06C 126 TaxID=1917281 RepID=UPI0008D8F2BF|nr:phage tail protein [Pseudomonas sp. 06C 126]OHW40848.1 phage tail protein [Pseudomonas sp. 06C 126]